MTNTLAEKTLVEGLDDWVPLAAVAGFAKLSGVPVGDIKNAVIETVLGLIQQQLVVLGHVTEEGFVEAVGPPEQLLQEIHTVPEGMDSDAWHWAFWLNNTESGDAAAREYRSRSAQGGTP